MAETDSVTPAPEPPIVRRRRRPWILGFCVLIPIALVLLAPVILSTAPARAIALAQINSRINGTIQIEGGSIGWFRGIRLNGVAITDADGRRILQCSRLNSDLNLERIIRRRWNPGRTEIAGLDVLIRREPDGSLNWSRLFKRGPSSGSNAQSESSGEEHHRRRSGSRRTFAELVLENASVTYEDSSHGRAPLYLRSLHADVRRPATAGPVSQSIEAQMQIGSAEPQRVSIVAEADYDAPSRTLDIRDLRAVLADPQSFQLTAKGRIAEIGRADRIVEPVTGSVEYDAAALWKMILPLLPSEQRQALVDTKAAGAFREPFEIRGAFPAGEPFSRAIRNLAADVEIRLDLFDAQGVTVRHADLPIRLRDGVARIADAADRPPAPAEINSGSLDIGGCAIDLTAEPPSLSTPPNLPLIRNAALNPTFANWALGRAMSNPIFVDPTRTGGFLDATVIDCNRLPLSAAAVDSDPGVTLNLAVRQLRTANRFLDRLDRKAHLKRRGFQGDIPSERITIRRGIADQDLHMTVMGQFPLRMFGKVRIADGEMMPLTLELPWKLFGLEPPAESGQGIELALRGRLDDPRFSIDLGDILRQAGQNTDALDQLQNLFGRDRK